MKLLRKYIVAAIGGFLILILVLFRITGWNHFTKTAEEFQSLAADPANIISLKDNLKNFPVVDLRSNEVFLKGHPENAINIPATNLLSVESRKILKENHTGIILYSDDYAILARAWVILVQMGYKNIYLSCDGLESDELLKFKFRPDSTIKPE